MVLPPITFVLKKIWKANQVKLKTTSVFNYLSWRHMVTKTTSVDWVGQVIEAYYEEIGTTQVDG